MSRRFLPLIAIAFLGPVSASAECLTCDWKVENPIPSHLQDVACKDLYQAACIDSNTANTNRNRYEEIGTALKVIVEDARKEALTVFGAKTTQEAIRTSLVGTVGELKAELSEKARKYFFDSDYNSFVGDKELFKAHDVCQAEKATIQASMSSTETDIEKLKLSIQSALDFKKRSDTLRATALASDLPKFLSQIGERCKRYAELPEASRNHVALGKFKEACANTVPLRRQLTSLFRTAEDLESQERAKALIIEYNAILDEPLYFWNPPTDASAMSEVARLQTEVYRLKNNNLGCDDFIALSSFAKKKQNSILNKLNRSRSTVEALIAAHFTTERKAEVSALFTRVKKEVLDVAFDIVKNERDRWSIASSYPLVKLGWVEKPASSAYMIDPETSLELLDQSKIARFDGGLTAFFDPNLSFYTQINAFYMPVIKLGEESHASSVNMMPAFLRMYDSNRYAFLSVLAHEVGHHIGPAVSRTNGFDLTEAHRPMTDCLSDSTSIRLVEGQADEAIADSVSATVLAKLIKELPVEKRLSASGASVEPFCIFEEAGIASMSIHFESTHPASILRVAGTFGANKYFREAMGCTEESPEYKTCSWEKTP